MSPPASPLSLFFALACTAASAVADSTIVFNEIMYHPAENDPALEWIELHNQMGVNMDISGWSLDGAAQFKFLEGTVIPGGAYFVVAVSPTDLAAVTGYTNAYGPFFGRLSTSGARLELRNNNQRLMDWIEYGTDGDWPVGPDGGGVSLAKMNPNTASPPATNWRISAQSGGTPGAPNFPDPNAPSTITVLLPMTAAWRYQDSGADSGPAWRGPDFNDTDWSAGQALFYGGNAQPPAGELQPISTLFNTGVDDAHHTLTPGVPDPHYLLTVSAQSTPPPPPIAATVIQNHPAWLANDALSSWIGPVNPGTTDVAPGPYRYRTAFSLSGFDPAAAQILLTLAADNRVNDVLLNGVSHGISFAGFDIFSPTVTLAGGFVDGTNTLEFVTANDGTAPNPAGFRARLDGIARAVFPRTTPLNPVPATTAFRALFVFNGDPTATALSLRVFVNDGAVFYLNGAEVGRVNLPTGAIAWNTPAATNLADGAWGGSFSISPASLVTGTNVLAVEIHQSVAGTNSLLFGAELSATPAAPSPPLIQFNEIAGATNSVFWLELSNSGTNAVSLQGCVLLHDGLLKTAFAFSSDDAIPAGGFLALDESRLGFHPQAGDRLFLYAPYHRSLLDAVVVKKSARARLPDGSGRWLYPALPTPGAANLFALHDEIVINEILYHHRDLTKGASPEAWIELFNRSDHPVDLGGWEFDKGVDFVFPAGTTIGPGAYLVVTADTNYLGAIYPGVPMIGNFSGRLSHGSDLIALRDSNRNAVNEVRYFDGGRWPEDADGGGSSLELRSPFADNTAPETWAASDESTKSAWNTYTYRGVAAGDGGPTLWNEFVLGLLDRGEVLLDDISVIESPDTAPRELLQNGSFETGTAAWRILGNHRGEIITDPDNAANHVLHLTATGPTEHMHNHAETTLASGATVVNGRTYKISFRARWLSGSNHLHTRLYFNRVAQVTPLDVPNLNGTPGTQNSRFESNLGPTFADFQHRPAVPPADQPVTVSVTAADPDGVARCSLWWSVNGSAWNSAPMSLAASGRFEANIPGQGPGSVVQFYIEATDLPGAKSTFPARGRNSRALYKVNDNQAIPGQLHNLRLVMTAADAAVLHAPTNVMSNGQIGATLVYDEQEVFYDVGVHLQSSERGRNDDTRVGFTIEFPPDHLFRGVHDSITVDRSGGYSGIGGDQDEILLKHVINHAGGLPGMYDDLVRFIAPLNQHTGPGLLLMAKYGDEFLDTQYPDGSDGKQFKLELIYYPLTTTDANPQSLKLPQPDDVLGTDIQDRGASREAYRWFFLNENHHELDDYSPLIALAKTFSLSGTALDSQSRQLMDLDEWMRIFAMKTLTGDVDTYSQGYPHNLIIYFRPEDGKALAFLWDMDFSWVRAVNAPLAPPIGSANIAKIIALPNNRRLFYAHLNDIVTSTFNTTYMTPWTAHYGGLVGQNFSGLLNYIGQRAAYVRSQLPAQVPFAVTSNSGQDFLVNTTSTTIAGTAWLNVRRIVIEGPPQPLLVNWPSLTSWQVTVPLILGTNRFNFLAYDFAGNLIATRTLTVTTSATGGGSDNDADGMPDVWEAAIDLDPFRDDADDDPDGDGLSNLQEYFAGTNPFAASSSLKILASPSPLGVRLTFRAAAGRSYTIQYRDDLQTGPWNSLTNIPPQIADRTADFSDAPPAGARFYRLVTPQLP